MLLYRAMLAEPPVAVIGIALRPISPPGGVGQAYRVKLRYATASGEVKAHRGRVVALGAAAGLTVAGYQVEGTEVLVSLAPSPVYASPGVGNPVCPGPESPGAASPGLVRVGPQSLADSFVLPLTLTAWGVTRLTAVHLTLMASASAQGDAVAVRGILMAVLQSPGGALRMRVPFLRLIAAPEEAEAGGAGGATPRWQVSAAVTGVRVEVEPGGKIQGEARVRLRLTGGTDGLSTVTAPEPADRQLLVPRPQTSLRLVRTMLGHVARLTARWAGPGQLLAEGRLELDLYWVDDRGASRWSGQVIPFSSLLAASEMAGEPTEADRLEPRARVDRLKHGVADGAVLADALLQVTVTILRDRVGTLGGEQYRLEQILGSVSASLLVRERLLCAEPVETVTGQGPEAGTGGQEEAGEQRLWQSVERTTWEPEPGGREARKPAGSIGLPGPVRHLLSLATMTGAQPAVQALVLLEAGGARLVTGRLGAGLGEPGRPANVLAVPMMAGDSWRLYLWAEA